MDETKLDKFCEIKTTTTWTRPDPKSKRLVSSTKTTKTLNVTRDQAKVILDQLKQTTITFYKYRSEHVELLYAVTTNQPKLVFAWHNVINYIFHEDGRYYDLLFTINK